MTPPVNSMVDAVYVLSVPNFSERIEHITDQMKKFGIKFQFVFEHDPKNPDPALTKAIFDPNSLQGRDSTRSLVLKNIEVWRDAINKGHRSVMVFEDDAILCRNFIERFAEAMRATVELKPGWMIFLGGFDSKVPDYYFLERGPLVELPIDTAEGCVYDHEAMRRRLAWLETHKVTLPIDHQIKLIDAETGVREYRLRHPIVDQGSLRGIFKSHLDDRRRSYSLWYNRLRNLWKKLRRRYFRWALVYIKILIGIRIYSPGLEATKDENHSHS